MSATHCNLPSQMDGVTVQLDASTELRLFRETDAAPLFALVEANRHHLRPWMAWLDATRSVDDVRAFINDTLAQYETGKGPNYTIHHHGRLCGTCGFHPFDTTNCIGGIGYWLDHTHTGKGIMTCAVAALLHIGFKNHELNRIDIACATDNHKSRAIPERLGFHLDGILRQQQLVNGTFVDHAIYTMLAEEFHH